MRAGVRHITASAALTVLVASCGASESNGTSSSSRPLPPGQDQDPGVAHVHGLGVDPADGVLYAATHHGLFRIPEKGKAERVAARFQDTMGFTITGPRTFLGSGHPDFRKDPDLPPLLGLIRSTDGAETWQSVSLGGQADFHALRNAHGKVYGWDATSGRFLVSSDSGATWDTRATLSLRDFVVNPADPEGLLATAESGVLRSADGGRTWTALPAAPRLVVLAWDKAVGLFGVGPDGVVRRSADAGTSWLLSGGVGGMPEAVTVSVRDGVSTLYVAVSGRGVLASTDLGQSFVPRYVER